MACTFRPLTAAEIDELPSGFYQDVDRLGLGGRYRGDMLGTIIGAFDEQAKPSPKLVGAWVLAPLMHAGPVWIAPEFRGRSHDLRAGLWELLREAARNLGVTRALMIAMDGAPQVAGMVAKLPSTEVPGQLYIVDVR